MLLSHSQPLHKEQLIGADTCPLHGRELVMAEYGNPDSLKECTLCEAELAELNREITTLQDEQLADEQALIDARFELALLEVS